jgi:hypothetical protein
VHWRHGAPKDAKPAALILHAKGVRLLAPLRPIGLGHFQADAEHVTSALLEVPFAAQQIESFVFNVCPRLSGPSGTA